MPKRKHTALSKAKLVKQANKNRARRAMPPTSNKGGAVRGKARAAQIQQFTKARAAAKKSTPSTTGTRTAYKRGK